MLIERKKSVPPASAGGSNTQLAGCALNPPAYAGGTDFITRVETSPAINISSLAGRRAFLDKLNGES
jgi:hypothetical protein